MCRRGAERLVTKRGERKSRCGVVFPVVTRRRASEMIPPAPWYFLGTLIVLIGIVAVGIWLERRIP